MKFPAIIISACFVLLFLPLGSAGEPPRIEGIEASFQPILSSEPRGDVIHVPGDYTSIQAAIDASDHRDLILVAPGSYVENIDFKGMAITVRSDEDGNPSTIDLSPETSVIDGNRAGCVVIFEDGEDPGSVLMGFTVTNGLSDRFGYFFSTTTVGGGICCLGSSPTIEGNRIIGNTADLGGGVYLESSSGAIIKDNTITANSIDGIVMADASASIQCNRIWDNQGYGIYLVFCDYGADTSEITDNSIIGNLSSGIFNSGLFASVEGNTIVGNAFSGLLLATSAHTQITDNLIAGNATSGIKTGYYTFTWIDRNVIVGNRSTGILTDIWDTMDITNTVIAGNVGEYGGGLYVYYSADIDCINCTIMKNRANQIGGGISNGSGYLRLINSIVWNNHSPSEPQIHDGGGGQTLVEYCDVKDGWPGTGNIDDIPLFDPCPPLGHWTAPASYDAENRRITFYDGTADWVDNKWAGKLINPDTTQRIHFFITGNTQNSISVWADWATIESGIPWVPANGQYHMTGYHLTRESPCIDAGTRDKAPDHDIDGDGRPHLAMPDMGADEYPGVFPYKKPPNRWIPSP